MSRLLPSLTVDAAWRCAAGAALVGAFLLFANNGRHYSHEFRELHSARHYSNAELMGGEFDPGPSPLRSSEEVGTWYANKLLHLTILRALINAFGDGADALVRIQIVYALMLPLAIGLFTVALGRLEISVARAALSAALALLSPVIIYLGFKTLGDAPALLFSAVGVLLFAVGVRRQWRLMFFGAGAAGALSAMCAWPGPSAVVGLMASLITAPPRGHDRGSMLRASVMAALGAMATFSMGNTLLGGSVGSYASGIVSVAGFSKSGAMWLYAVFEIGLFGVVLWAIAPLAVLSSDSVARRRFLVWFAVAAVWASIGAGFMEPRYLIGALVPIAGLAAMGIEAVWDRLRQQRWSPWARNGVAALTAVILVASAVAVQPLTSYETDQHDLFRLVREEAASEGDAILTPWNYSDFHLLKFAFPGRPVYLIQSAATEDGTLVEDEVWTANFAKIYGESFLQDGDALISRLRQRPVLVGWTILPFLQNLRGVLDTVGLGALASMLDRLNPRDHAAETWLWRDARFSVRETRRYGQYTVYDVDSTGVVLPPPADVTSHRANAHNRKSP